ncbi:MAG: GNAT family N-acetyltransferase [Rickettsiales bacterium]|nr:GNAT family N-acetyltransferase [Rickettsiales bacterium]
MTAKSRVTFRDAELTDLSKLSVLAHRIWREHYVPIIGAQQVEYMLKKWYNLDALTQQMQEPERFTRLVEADGQMAGYIQYGRKDDAMFIYKVYIEQTYRGQGIGRQLFDQIGSRPLELRVNKDNVKSIAFYERYGFEITAENLLEIGDGFVMDDYVMRCES